MSFSGYGNLDRVLSVLPVAHSFLIAKWSPLSKAQKGYGKKSQGYLQFSSVQFSCSVVSDSVTPQTAVRQASLSITNSRSLLRLMSTEWWCHPTISSSVGPFSSCLQSFPASGSFQMSQFFTSGGQSIGTSASVSVLPMNIQDWSPLGWTGWISLQSKGLSRVFSNTTVQKPQFFAAQPFLQSNSHIRTWLLEKP